MAEMKITNPSNMGRVSGTDQDEGPMQRGGTEADDKKGMSAGEADN